uniref:DUF4147 domain-containing protein n=1 Tax=Steinernema glaseri TaxID=37863 RepID=A0A1I7ZKJ1_9BILA
MSHTNQLLLSSKAPNLDSILGSRGITIAVGNRDADRPICMANVLRAERWVAPLADVVTSRSSKGHDLRKFPAETVHPTDSALVPLISELLITAATAFPNCIPCLSWPGLWTKTSSGFGGTVVLEEVPEVHRSSLLLVEALVSQA